MQTRFRIALHVVAALALVTAISTPPCTPTLDWVVNPLRPGETALITGACLTNATIRVCSTEPACFPNCTNLLPVQQWDGSIKASLPPDFPLGVLNFTVASPGGGSSGSAVTSNAPVVDWFSTDSWVAGSAFAGGDLILYGKALAFSQPIDGSGVLDCRPLPPLLGSGPALVPAPTLSVRLRAIRTGSVNASTVLPSYPLQVTGAASCYRVATRLPPGIPDGNYTIEVNNGLLPVGAALPATPELLPVSAATAPRWPNGTWTVGVHCNTTDIGGCLSKARAAGGGTVRVPPGFYRMPTGRTLGLGSYVALTGTTSRAADTVLSWDDEPANGNTCALSPWNPNTPRYPCALVYNVESYNYEHAQHKPLAIRNLTLLVTSPVFKIIQMTDCSGCEALNLVLNVTIDAVRFPDGAAAYPPLYVRHAKQWRAVGLLIVSGGGNESTPRTDDPATAAFHLQAVNDGRLWDVVAHSFWAGWFLSCLDRVSMERTDVRSTSPLRQRGNSLNPFCGPIDASRGNDHVYFGQNYDAGTDTLQTWETFTQDGAGGPYAGFVVAIGVNASTGRQTLQTTIVRPDVNGGAGTALLSGQSVSVMGGAGLGQWRRITAVEPVAVRVAGNATVNATLVPTGAYTLHLEAPFSLPLVVNNSVIAVSTYKGNIVFEGNEWTNGTTVQTYGSSLDLVLAGNVLRNFYSGGLVLWGLGMQRNGWQPSLRMLVEHNTLICSGNIQSFSSLFDPLPPNLGFNGSTVVLNYAHVIRRNAMPGSLDIIVRGQAWDVVVEGNTFSNGTCPVKVMLSCPNVGGCNSVLSTGQTAVRGPGSVKVGGGNGYDAWQVPRYIHVSTGVQLPVQPPRPSCLPTPSPSQSPSRTPPSHTPSSTTSCSTSTSTSSTASATHTRSPSSTISPAASPATSLAPTESASASASASISVTMSAFPSSTGGTTQTPSNNSTSVGTPTVIPVAPPAAIGVSGSNDGLAPGAGAGVAVGVVSVLALCAAVAVVAVRRRSKAASHWSRTRTLQNKTRSSSARRRSTADATFLNPSHALTSPGAGTSGKGLQLSSMKASPQAARAARGAARWSVVPQPVPGTVVNINSRAATGGRASRFGIGRMFAKNAVPASGHTTTLRGVNNVAAMHSPATGTAAAGRRQSHLPLAFSDASGGIRLSVHRSAGATAIAMRRSIRVSSAQTPPTRASLAPVPGSSMMTQRASAAQVHLSGFTDSASLL